MRIFNGCKLRNVSIPAYHTTTHTPQTNQSGETVALAPASTGPSGRFRGELTLKTSTVSQFKLWRLEKSSSFFFLVNPFKEGGGP